MSYKIIEAEIKNFKNIAFKRLELDGRSFIIQAGNGKGKTSMFQALMCTLTKQDTPQQPIRKGTDGAEIEVVISDGDNHYKIRNVYTEKPDGTIVGKIAIKDKEGKAVNKSVFYNLMGKASIDIFSDFLEQKTEKQIEILKQLSGVSDQINTLTLERRTAYEQRTDVNRDIARMEAHLEGKTLPQDKPAAIDLEPLNEKLRSVEELQQKWNAAYLKLQGLEQKHQEKQREIEKAHADAINTESKIQELKRQIEELEKVRQNHLDNAASMEQESGEILATLEKGRAWLTKNPEAPKAQDILSEIERANLHNKSVEEYEAIDNQWRELANLKKKSEELSKQIKDTDQKKMDVIAASKIPVQGLTFSEEGVFLDGLPFTKEQINTARIIEVGMAVACAMNPTLKLIRVDASLLDKNTFKSVVEYSNASGMQVIYEVVDWEAGEEKIKWVESMLE